LLLLRDRWTDDKQPFLDIVQQDKVTLTCYCGPGEFCHRYIAVDVLEKVAERQHIPFERGGEIDPYTGRAWLAPDDPRREELQLGVAPVVSPDGQTDLGWAAMGVLANPRNLNVAIELGHFRENVSAEQYLDGLEQNLKTQ